MQIPHGFSPRNYQMPLLDALDSGYNRAICIWHRRAGKDKTLINLIVKKAFERKGLYYYFFPKYAQGRKVLWDGIDNDGFKLLDHFPKQLVANSNVQEMKLELKNGSIFQIIGTDNYDAIRGTNPMGCVFSEFAYQDAEAWKVVKPILRLNGGWAAFNTTPNGKNHAYKMFKMAQGNPKWFCERLTVSDTFKPDGRPLVSQEDLDEERAEGTTEEEIEREYMCSFNASSVGAYYADLMNDAHEQGRVSSLPFYNDKSIDIYFDLGVSDMTSVWFKQNDGEFINFINYFEDSNKTIGHYIMYIDEYLEQKKGKLGKIYVPHDASQRGLVSENTVLQEMKEHYGDTKVVHIKRGKLYDGIQKVRKYLPKCRFDIDACERGIECLSFYKKEYDDKLKVFKDTPLHDWSSHGSDAFRYFAISHKERTQPMFTEDKLKEMQNKLGNPMAFLGK